MGELLSLRSDGRAFSRSDGPRSRLSWSDAEADITAAVEQACYMSFDAGFVVAAAAVCITLVPLMIVEREG